jgi:hypothetical protein
MSPVGSVRPDRVFGLGVPNKLPRLVCYGHQWAHRLMFNFDGDQLDHSFGWRSGLRYTSVIATQNLLKPMWRFSPFPGPESFENSPARDNFAPICAGANKDGTFAVCSRPAPEAWGVTKADVLGGRPCPSMKRGVREL